MAESQQGLAFTLKKKKLWKSQPETSKCQDATIRVVTRIFSFRNSRDFHEKLVSFYSKKSSLFREFRISRNIPFSMRNEFRISRNRPFHIQNEM